MPAGLGGGGYVAWQLEDVMGTYEDPATAGTVFIPIIEESLSYAEDRYVSPQIRQTSIVSEVKQSYYHVEGDITLEADPAFLPYIMHCSRHNIAKAGVGPYTYTYTPSSAASATTAATGNVPRTASITIVRNGIGFGYAGCVVGRHEWTIEDGVLRLTIGVLGLSEVTPGALGSPAWSNANLYGADSHSIFVAAAGVAPTFGAAAVDFNGFTFAAEYNAEAQNRIQAARSASYISYGETEATYDTELDFVSKTEYDNFKATTTRAIKLSSLHGGATLAAATDGVEVQVNRSIYETYDVGLGGMGDLIMAGVTGRAIGIAGGNPFEVKVKSAANIA